jgi:transcriptional regulator with XRE-family HTH domain
MANLARPTRRRVDVGAKVRSRREEVGLSREELAAGAKSSYATIVRLERGHIPYAETLAAIAAVLGTTVEELLKPNGEAA